MTPSQKAQLGTLVFNQLVLLIPIVGSLLIAGVTYAIVKVHGLGRQVSNNTANIEHISNGGGTAKITDVVRSLGLIPSLAHGQAMMRRKGDRQPYAPVVPPITAETTNSTGGTE